jgi:hypothetical protein
VDALDKVFNDDLGPPLLWEKFSVALKDGPPESHNFIS